ncbi:MAG: T9SS type A sorting domain-containing protein [candidate division KSB1 bacterium]|nr:T9SS type A sorting domain-containing protein [candidate division KSB1 bacterium]
MHLQRGCKAIGHEGEGRFTRYGLPSSNPYPCATALDTASGRRGNRWNATPKGLVRHDGSAWPILSIYNSPLPDNAISTVRVDEEGTIWPGMSYAGLVKYDGQRCTVDDTTNSPLPENRVYALAIDSWGNKWIGAANKGVAIFRDGRLILEATGREHSPPLPQFALAQNYPNPFNSSTRIWFTLGQPATVEMAIHDQMGRAVVGLLQGCRPQGNYAVTWDGPDQAGRPLPSGIYICQLRDGVHTAMVEMVLVH